MTYLYEFYGTECPHCIDMKPFVERLKKEEGVEIESLEVWHNEANEAKFVEMDKDMCGGVPFFINTKTNAFVCGEATYEELKAWAKGE
jgi:thiol-disulfide isomerase/thioredoxin